MKKTADRRGLTTSVHKFEKKLESADRQFQRVVCEIDGKDNYFFATRVRIDIASILVGYTNRKTVS